MKRPGRKQLAGNATATKIKAVRDVVTCADLDIVATVATAVKVAGVKLASEAMLLRVLEQMAARFDQPEI